MVLPRSSIHSEPWEGREFYVTENCRTKGFRKGKFILIPPYDEYLIGYKSRDVVLPTQYRHKAHNNSGIFQPVIARDGIICGNWSPFKDDCLPEFFNEGHNATSLQPAWQSYIKFRDT